MKLRLKYKPSFKIDMSSLTPELCTTKSVTEVENHLLQTSGQQFKVAELFDVSTGDPNILEFTGTCKELDYVGANMNSGRLSVSGDIGHYVGANLSGGHIEVRGTIGDHCGHAMSGGRITVYGDAGDFCGGALTSDTHGLAGGEIFILGNCGKRCGDHMRRGLIVVRDATGDHCGSKMKAGTILVGGKYGNFCGQGMKRGSIILNNPPDQQIGKTFILQNSQFRTDFLILLSKYLQQIDSGFEPLPLSNTAHRYIGDLGTICKGEILVLNN